MSIIITHINENGIVHAADSNLTDHHGAHAGTAQKVFEIPRLNAGLTVAGNYSVANQRMDEWISIFIGSDTLLSKTNRNGVNGCWNSGLWIAKGSRR
jgi:hypothetical protein